MRSAISAFSLYINGTYSMGAQISIHLRMYVFLFLENEVLFDSRVHMRHVFASGYN
jgi:hypothetical protein